MLDKKSILLIARVCLHEREREEEKKHITAHLIEYMYFI